MMTTIEEDGKKIESKNILNYYNEPSDESQKYVDITGTSGDSFFENKTLYG